MSSDLLSPPISANTLRPFSNESRCARCGHGPRLIRIHWCPYAIAQDGVCAGPSSGAHATGGHYHRHCLCGAEWIERCAPVTRASV